MSGIVPLPRIHKLTPEVADQIAAGEVIERPASVLKELLENSIDAAANRISIEIAGAGISLIGVHDNGHGIHKDDLYLALQSHATSKLTSVADLSQIASLGFRGEALPSIASVSRLQLVSRQKHAEHAWSMDNALEIRPAARSEGTTVEVRDLFHATPARRKFLKSERTEWLHIQSLMKAMALGHSNIAFQLRYDDQQVLHYSRCSESAEQRVADVCGKAFLKHSIEVDAASDGMHVCGWMGLNEAASSQSNRQYFFVNGRLVQDKHINHALRLACSDKIDSGRHPGYVLFLQINPAAVDINVHPAKSEVRFAEPRNVHDFIYAAITRAFNSIYSSMAVTAERNTASPTRAVSEPAANYQYRSPLPLPQLPAGKSRFMSLAGGQYVIVETGTAHWLINMVDTQVLLALDDLLHAWRVEQVPQRPLLVAVSCRLERKQEHVLQSRQEDIAKWGFAIEPIAPAQAMIRGIPARLTYADTIPLVQDFLTSLCNNERSEQIAVRMAEHVHDAGLDISAASIEAILQKIADYEQQVGTMKSLPWCRLDAAALAALLHR